MKFSLHIFEIMKVVDACRYHIVRMNHTLHFLRQHGVYNHNNALPAKHNKPS